MSSIRSSGPNTPLSTSRSYSTRFQRFNGTVGSGIDESSDSRLRSSTSQWSDTLRATVDRPARGYAREIRCGRGLDPVASRLHRSGLETEPRDRGGVAVEPVIGMAHQRLERCRLGTLDAPQNILALGGAPLREAAGSSGPRPLVDGVERARQERADLVRGGGDR